MTSRPILVRFGHANSAFPGGEAERRQLRQAYAASAAFFSGAVIAPDALISATSAAE